MKTYYVGLLLHRHKDGTYSAQYEVARNKDYLSCELYDYYGERIITKNKLSQSIRENYSMVLKAIQDGFPNKTIKRVLLTIA